MQLHGAWAEALDEAARARERCDRSDGPRRGGEALLPAGRAPPAARRRTRRPRRPTARRAAAATSHSRASRCCGWRRATPSRGRRDPPGARRDGASRSQRARLLPARVEIALAARRRRGARGGRRRARRDRRALGAPVLRAIAAQVRGAVPLAEGDAAGRAARRSAGAWRLWQELDAPYEARAVARPDRPGVPGARRRGRRRARARRGPRRLRGGSARRPTSPASKRSAGRGRATGAA